MAQQTRTYATLYTDLLFCELHHDALGDAGPHQAAFKAYFRAMKLVLLAAPCLDRVSHVRRCAAIRDLQN